VVCFWGRKSLARGLAIPRERAVNYSLFFLAMRCFSTYVIRIGYPHYHGSRSIKGVLADKRYLYLFSVVAIVRTAWSGKRKES
jgi:hypothetical protein